MQEMGFSQTGTKAKDSLESCTSAPSRGQLGEKTLRIQTLRDMHTLNGTISI